jgi:hypothetical protein
MRETFFFRFRFCDWNNNGACMKSFLLCAFAALLALSSCRTNDIARYPIKDQNVLYHTLVAGDAAETHVHITSPSSHPIGEILTGIGAGIANIETQAKISRAIDPDSLGSGLTLGIRDILHTYFGARTVFSTSDSPVYIVEVHLEKYQIHSGDNGLYANVKGMTKIYQTGTGRLLWENNESISVPLSRIGTSPGQRSVSGIVNASELLSMSDEDLRSSLIQAAQEVGRRIGEQLREDIAND